MRNGAFTFAKALVSSQLASLVDILITFLLANVFGLYYVVSTFIGSVSGGVFNCIVNYGWTFNAHDCPKRNIAVKYFIVWGGSLLLNTYGTYIITEWIKDIHLTERMAGFAYTNVFMIPKIAVAVLVGIFWNYMLQKYFVFRNVLFDKLIKKNNDYGV